MLPDYSQKFRYVEIHWPVKNIAANINSATINSILTPQIVTEEKITPEILSAIGDNKLSIK